ncbi:uncharacterized protein A4U43_C08F23560 [Asparagus officinalis]|nr:uncharacterized protein A4U43_C08F23560 [Asparagus officinalis]
MRPSMGSVVAMLEGTVEVEEPMLESLGFLRLYSKGFEGAMAMTMGMAYNCNLNDQPTPRGFGTVKVFTDPAKSTQIESY